MLDAFERDAKINALYPRGLNANSFDPDYRG
jgi:hypothetical protein